MKQSKTVLLGEAIASLWDDDPDMYEQLLVHRLRDYLPELLGPMYRWLQEVRFDEGVLRLQVSPPAGLLACGTAGTGLPASRAPAQDQRPPRCRARALHSDLLRGEVITSSLSSSADLLR